MPSNDGIDDDNNDLQVLSGREALDMIALISFGRTLTHALENQVCVMCGEPATTFDDEVSKKEYDLSAMCQQCQNIVFATNPRPSPPQ